MKTTIQLLLPILAEESYDRSDSWKVVGSSASSNEAYDRWRHHQYSIGSRINLLESQPVFSVSFLPRRLFDFRFKAARCELDGDPVSKVSRERHPLHFEGGSQSILFAALIASCYES